MDVLGFCPAGRVCSGDTCRGIRRKSRRGRALWRLCILWSKRRSGVCRPRWLWVSPGLLCMSTFVLRQRLGRLLPAEGPLAGLLGPGGHPEAWLPLGILLRGGDRLC